MKQKYCFHNKDFAVLYRFNNKSFSIEKSFNNKKIPYIKYGSFSFFKYKEIKTFISYLRFLVNFRDDNSLKEIINYPSRSIGKITIKKIFDFAFQKNKNVYHVLDNLNIYNTKLKISNRIQNKIKDFLLIFNKLKNQINQCNAHEIAYKLFNMFEFKYFFDKKSIEYKRIKEYIENIKHYVESVSKEQGSVINYLQNISLYSDNDDLDNNKVSLMTIHMSKGLEFKVVFVAGLEDDVFPFYLNKNKNEIEEERRLFYVALTRAKEFLFLSYSLKKKITNKIINLNPSRFLNEIDKKYFIKNTNIKTTNINNTLLSCLNKKNKNKMINHKKIKPGSMIDHVYFGKGVIINIQNHSSLGKIILVNFKKNGIKKIILSFSKMKFL